ncbi:MAG: hypothetical protein P4L49_18945 [Desulfosporosinus sp.]|nr:hypothetical protein [Desulfosporosinus sp.]
MVDRIRIDRGFFDEANFIVFLRKRIKPKEIKGQMCLDLDTYEYRVIVTNMDDLTYEEV